MRLVAENDHWPFRWRKREQHCLALAKAVLREHGFPVTYAKLRHLKPPPDHLIVSAFNVVLASRRLSEHRSRGQIDFALEQYEWMRKNALRIVFMNRDRRYTSSATIDSDLSLAIAQRARPKVARDKKKQRADALSQNVRELYDKLQHVPKHNRASMIARELGTTAKHVREILGSRPPITVAKKEKRTH